MEKSRGVGRATFASVLLALDGILNIIYGLAAIGNSAYLDHPTHYIIGQLHAWGWVSLILGVLELIAAGSVLRGHAFGRWFGMFVGCLVVIGALLDMPDQPYWSLAVVGISLWIIYGLATYHDAQPASPELSLGPETAPPVGPRPIA